jgi:hypothetical protein
VDEQGVPIFSLVVYRQDEDRIDPAATGEDVGGGILTFTVELTVPTEVFRRIKARLRAMVYGDDADPSLDVDLATVPFLDGKVTVAVAGETGADAGAPATFVKGEVGAGKTSGVGPNRKAIMVNLTQSGAALMSQIDELKTLPINVGYELSFEHRLLGVTMRVWMDVTSSYHLVQDVYSTKVGEEDSGIFGWGSRDVYANKISEVTETLVRNKTAGVTVIPQSSQVDSETLMSLEKFGLDMLNKAMEKALEAEPPPDEIDRTYIEKYFSDFANQFNFNLDRRMVLIQSYTPSANISNVFTDHDINELVAYVDLRTAFFTFLKIPIRVNADFEKLPIDSVTVTVTYQRKRVDGSGREERVDSFDFTDGSSIQTFLAYANSLADVTYDWSATVHYTGSPDNYTFRRLRVKDNFLVVDVGSLGVLYAEVGLGLVDLAKFPSAKVSLRYHSAALGATVERQFLLDTDNQEAVWAEVIHEEPSGGYEYKVDWLRAGGDILEGEWTATSASRLRFDAPVPDQLEIVVVCTGNFKDGDDQISEVAVSLRYEDPDNDYVEEGHLVFTDDKQQLPWTVDLRNRELRDYRYRYSIVYHDGVVRSFPEEGEWYRGEPGFITVGEKYTVEVQLIPALLTYPDSAKVVQVDLTYDDPEHGVHQVDSFVFSHDTPAPRTWRVRGSQDGPKRYTARIRYFSATGELFELPPIVQEAEALVIPPAPPPPAPPPPEPVATQPAATPDPFAPTPPGP